MELHGSLVANLEAAVLSARRLRGRRIYPETLQFWGEVLAKARDAAGTMVAPDLFTVAWLADELEVEIEAHRGP